MSDSGHQAFSDRVRQENAVGCQTQFLSSFDKDALVEEISYFLPDICFFQRSRMGENFVFMESIEPSWTDYEEISKPGVSIM